MRKFMLGAGSNSEEQGKMPDEDLVGGILGDDPQKWLGLDAAISAAISSTDDDMSEELKRLAKRLSGTPRIHTAEDLEVAYAESVDRMIANRASDTVEVRQGWLEPEDSAIHERARRALEIRAACRGVSVDSVAILLREENEQR